LEIIFPTDYKQLSTCQLQFACKWRFLQPWFT
jgi:hypothetical protein